MQPTYWIPSARPPGFDHEDIRLACAEPRQTVYLLRDNGSQELGIGFGGEARAEPDADGHPSYLCLGSLAGVHPEHLGAVSFLRVHNVRYPYIAGAMAHGIASPRLVIAMAKAGMLGFFGTGGLPLPRIEAGLTELGTALDGEGLSWGSNVIYSPDNAQLEQATIDLYLQYGVRRVSASAYMRLTPGIVQYACSGLSTDASGRIERRNHVFAKLSHPKTASLFLSPAPPKILSDLIARGKLSQAEADLAARLPIAEDVTVEADSGGHTDNRPLSAILPAVMALRDQRVARHGYTREVRIGAAGGLGTPGAVAAAFTFGADYVLTGSVNQGAIESGLSASGKEMLAKMGVTDVVMAPSPDMFEQGVKVQVLKRGSLFAGRAARLFELYKTYDSLADLPAEVKARLESETFRMPLEQVWEETQQYLSWRNPRELVRAKQDPKHQMARVFRWYVGKSSHWAVAGREDRQIDYQIWSGPAMGAFNTWVAGSFLAEPSQRGVVQIARNLLEGAAVLTRAQQLRACGLQVPSTVFDYRPRQFE